MGVAGIAIFCLAASVFTERRMVSKDEKYARIFYEPCTTFPTVIPSRQTVVPMAYPKSDNSAI